MGRLIRKVGVPVPCSQLSVLQQPAQSFTAGSHFTSKSSFPVLLGDWRSRSWQSWFPLRLLDWLLHGHLQWACVAFLTAVIKKKITDKITCRR